MLHGFAGLATWWGVAVFLVVSLVLSNVISMFLQHLRNKRIAAKLAKLSGTAAPSQAAASTSGASAGAGGHIAHDSAGSDDATDKDTALPVTVLTGFLGAGKTTLVNYILREPHGRRIAVIENELGAISIDHSLLRDGAGGNPADGVYVMKNGCICCTGGGSGGELERVLDRLLVLIEGQGFDYVLVETTGLADPQPLVSTFFRLPASQSAAKRFFLDGVVTVVDAKHISYHLGAGRGLMKKTVEARKQIGYADVVLLNKVDLVDEDGIAAAEALVRSVNPDVRIIRCSNASVGLDSILDIHAYDAERVNPTESLNHSGAMDHGEHSGNIRAVALHAHYPMSEQKLQRWVRSLVQSSWADLFRMKALVEVSTSNYPFVLQGVHSDVGGCYLSCWPESDSLPSSAGGSPGGPDPSREGCALEGCTLPPGAPVPPHRVSTMVIIGRDLHRDRLVEGWRSCIDQDADAADVQADVASGDGFVDSDEDGVDEFVGDAAAGKGPRSRDRDKGASSPGTPHSASQPRRRTRARRRVD